MGKNVSEFLSATQHGRLVNEVASPGLGFHSEKAICRDRGRDQRAAGVAKNGLKQISKGSGGRSQRVVSDASVSNLREAEVLAESVLRRSAGDHRDRQRGSCLGDPSLRVGAKLELSGIGRFEGSYLATTVTHTVGENGYQTSFEVNSDAGKSAPDFPDVRGSSGDRDRRGAGGVVVGLVLDNRDPDGLGRVKINLPGASEEEIGHWARIAAPMAGAGRGMFFLPEKDDEVLVAFEQGDSARPYVLGALWNGKDKPPESNTDGRNNLRLIKSRSGHVVRLDDSIGAEKIEIIDKSGANSITIDTSTNSITIKSAQDVSIEAPLGKISLSARSVEMKSTADTKVEAQATMDLQANAIMTIKGQLVNIN